MPRIVERWLGRRGSTPSRLSFRKDGRRATSGLPRRRRRARALAAAVAVDADAVFGPDLRLLLPAAETALAVATTGHVGPRGTTSATGRERSRDEALDDARAAASRRWRRWRPPTPERWTSPSRRRRRRRRRRARPRRTRRAPSRRCSCRPSAPPRGARTGFHRDANDANDANDDSETRGVAAAARAALRQCALRFPPSVTLPHAIGRWPTRARGAPRPLRARLAPPRSPRSSRGMRAATRWTTTRGRSTSWRRSSSACRAATRRRRARRRARRRSSPSTPATRWRRFTARRRRPCHLFAARAAAAAESSSGGTRVTTGTAPRASPRPRTRRPSPSWRTAATRSCLRRRSASSPPRWWAARAPPDARARARARSATLAAVVTSAAPLWVRAVRGRDAPGAGDARRRGGSRRGRRGGGRSSRQGARRDGVGGGGDGRRARVRGRHPGRGDAKAVRRLDGFNVRLPGARARGASRGSPRRSTGASRRGFPARRRRR